MYLRESGCAGGGGQQSERDQRSPARSPAWGSIAPRAKIKRRTLHPRSHPGAPHPINTFKWRRVLFFLKDENCVQWNKPHLSSKLLISWNLILIKTKLTSLCRFCGFVGESDRVGTIGRLRHVLETAAEAAASMAPRAVLLGGENGGLESAQPQGCSKGGGDAPQEQAACAGSLRRRPCSLVLPGRRRRPRVSRSASRSGKSATGGRSQPSNSPLSRRARLASTPACVPRDTCFGIRDFGTWLINRSVRVCLSGM